MVIAWQRPLSANAPHWPYRPTASAKTGAAKARAAAKIAHQNKTIVALNPAPARELPDELLALVDIITPNETEAEKLTGIRVENDDERMGLDLSQHGERIE